MKYNCRRPLTSTTPAASYSSDSYVYSSTTPTSPPTTTVSHVTTPVPSLHSGKSISDRKLSVAIPLSTLRVTMETSSTASNKDDDQQQQLIQTDEDLKSSEDSTKMSEDSTKISDDDFNHVESITPNESDDANAELEDRSEKIEETMSVEQRLKKISEEIEKFSNGDNADNHGRQSFFSLKDLTKFGLRSTDKKITPQIDSDYSNTMHVLGETTSIVSGDDSRKIKTIDLRQTNRALY